MQTKTNLIIHFHRASLEDVCWIHRDIMEGFLNNPHWILLPSKAGPLFHQVFLVLIYFSLSPWLRIQGRGCYWVYVFPALWPLSSNTVRKLYRLTHQTRLETVTSFSSPGVQRGYRLWRRLKSCSYIQMRPIERMVNVHGFKGKWKKTERDKAEGRSTVSKL